MLHPACEASVLKPLYGLTLRKTFQTTHNERATTYILRDVTNYIRQTRLNPWLGIIYRIVFCVQAAIHYV